MFQPLIPAQAVPDAGNLPYSPQFGDVYHSASGALAQAQHVFLHGNGLPERWRGRERFCVLETGFGLGLNFLALWRNWQDDPDRCRRLHMVSVEAHPFAPDALAGWLRRLLPDAWQPLADALIAQWPPLLPGLHMLEFAGGQVTLTLAFGQAERLVPELEVAVDAYFLDGFAPSRNPSMWSAELLASLAQRGVAGATAATWAVAGAVRRGLAAAGFTVEKRAGFGTKREMTVAHLSRTGPVAAAVLARARPAGLAVVVGAGVAGAGAAAALARNGWQVTVIAPEFAAGAPAASNPSGHHAAALTPLVDRDDSPRARLTRAGALRAAARWRDWTASSGPEDAVWRCGTVQVARRRHAQGAAWETWRLGLDALGFPRDWMHTVDAVEASRQAGLRVGRAGVYFPGGLLIRPQRLVERLLASTQVVRVPGQVHGLQRVGDAWRLVNAAGMELAQAELVVLAAARAVPALLRNSALAWPLGEHMQAVAGQISVVPAASLSGGPRCVVAGEGYVLPAVAGACVVGSTYDHETAPDAAAPVRQAGHDENFARLSQLLPEVGLVDAAAAAAPAGWAGWRAVLPGRLPAIGPLAGVDGIWLATGYASRGLCWSALAGDMLTTALSAAPGVLERELAQWVAPARSVGQG